MFAFIGRFPSRLWRIADFWRVSPIGQARIGSNLAGLLLFLVLLFGVIGLIIVVVGALFGLSPEQSLGGIDRWFDGAGPTLDVIGTFLIQKVLMAIVLLFCVAMGVVLLFFRDSNAPNWLATVLILLLCLFVGYCSSVNMVAPLDV